MKSFYKILRVFIVILLLTTGISYAQVAPDIEWEQTVGGTGNDLLYSVFQTSEGDFVAGGTSAGDFYLVKMNSDGELLWEKTLGLSDRNENAYDMAPTADGGAVLAGTCDGNPPQTWFSDIYIIKTNADGYITWDSQLGMDGIGETCRAIQQTSDGGYILCGDVWSSSETGYDVILMKLNSIGVISWQQEFDFGNGADHALSVYETSDGNFVVAGKTQADNELYDYDAFILKVNTAGGTLWFKTFGYDFPHDESANHIFETSDGGYLFAGATSEDGLINKDWYVVKTDENGNVIWQQTYGFSYQETASSACETTNGDFVVSGNVYVNDQWYANMIRYSSEGDTLWTKMWGDGIFSQGTECVIPTDDNGWITAGSVDTESNSFDGRLTKFGADAVGIEEFDNDAYNFGIIGVAPNPCYNKIKIKYFTESQNKAELSVYNLQGQQVEILQDMPETKGLHEKEFDIGILPDGIYLIQLRSESAVSTKKICVLPRQ